MIKLNQIEIELVTSWKDNITKIMAELNKAMNDLLTLKLAGLAKNKGINLESGEWRFDLSTMSFEEVDTTEKPKMVIPAGKGKIK